jgi:DNA-binding response OmpR family regulator
VILTDMRMPNVDGAEVTRRIRALPGGRAGTPIVLVTADMPAIRAGEAGLTGVDMCVQKPFTRAGLLAAVAAAARLVAPAPDNGSDEPLLNSAVLADLQQTLGSAAFAGHLDRAMRASETWSQCCKVQIRQRIRPCGRRRMISLVLPA